MGQGGGKTARPQQHCPIYAKRAAPALRKSTPPAPHRTVRPRGSVASPRRRAAQFADDNDVRPARRCQRSARHTTTLRQRCSPGQKNSSLTGSELHDKADPAQLWLRHKAGPALRRPSSVRQARTPVATGESVRRAPHLRQPPPRPAAPAAPPRPPRPPLGCPHRRK